MSVPKFQNQVARNTTESNNRRISKRPETKYLHTANISEYSSTSQPSAFEGQTKHEFISALEKEESQSEWSCATEQFKQNTPRSLCSSWEICTKYIGQSDSSLLRHPFYAYPSVKDPSIKEALCKPIPHIIRGDDGQELYLDLCKELNTHPVGLFYRGLLTDEINLSYYGVNSAAIRPMALALQYNDHVKKFNLTDNFLTRDACFHLGEMLYLNGKIEELNLTGCRIGAAGLLNLGQYLYTNKTLKYLNLARNNIGEEGGVYFAKFLEDGVSVPRINLSNNKLSLEASHKLANVFPFYGEKVITHLDLSLNDFFHPISTSKMISSFTFSNILQELNLARNSLQGEIVAKSIRRVMLIPTLSKLDLSNNKFSGGDIEIIVENLKKAINLVTLDLSYNPLSPTDAKTALEEMLKKKVKLQNLLMTNVSVNKDFIILLQRIKRKKSRRNFNVTFDNVLQNWTIVGVDPRELILKRLDYIANLKNADVVRFFWLLKWEYPIIAENDLPDRAHEVHIDLSNMMKELVSLFKGPKYGKVQYVNLAELCDFMHRLWPHRKPIRPPLKLTPEDVLFESRFSKLMSGDEVHAYDVK